VLERVADFLADGRAARLTQGTDAIAAGQKLPPEQFHLSGFAAAFGAFEGDEKTFRHVQITIDDSA
jgi:hypothetical protein